MAVAVLGLGGAAAGWLLTARSETPDAEVTAAKGTVIDPLAQAAGAPAIESVITILDTPADGMGASAPTAGIAAATPAPASGTPTAADSSATSAAATNGIGSGATILPASQLLQQATAMIATDPVRARLELTRLLDGNQLSATERAAAYQGINTLAEQLFFSSKILPGDTLSQWYTVKKGDALARIVRNEKLNVEWDFIQRINRLPNERAISPGMRLKLVYGPFDAEVVKREYRLNLYAGRGPDRVMVASLPCGLGEGNSTPVGTFTVRTGSKLKNPEWRNPRTGEYFAASNPLNPIGERWIGLQGADAQSARHTQYGIHGTIDPGSIGAQASMGCVRLGDAEVQVAYELLTGGSMIMIR